MSSVFQIILLTLTTQVSIHSSFMITQPISTRSSYIPSSLHHTFPFAISSSRTNIPRKSRSSSSSSSTFLSASSSDDLDGKDPFQILNLPNFTTDKKEIKRAYRRMAMKYHPDVVLDKNSSDEDRKRASENFAKINAAYEILSGKRNGGSQSSNSSQRSSKSSGWDPPHRRTSSYGSRVNNNSDFDWTDFMSNEYKKEQEKYDAGGDSFSAIFSDLLKSGAASMSGSSSGEGGILKDLVEFLESTVDGFSSGNYDAYDPSIQDLLIYGSIEEIKEEMEDTELLVQQLEKKLSDLVNEQEQYSDFSSSSQDPNISFVQKMEMEERKEEIQARKKVVDGYLTKARGRLLRLQNRYRELRVGSTGSRSSSSSSSNNNDYDNSRDSFSSSYSAGTSTTDNSSRSSSSSYSTTTSTDNSNDDEKSWRRESFGSSGRGRGRRTRQRPSSSPSSSPSSPSTSSYRDTSPPRPNNNPSPPPSQSPRRQPEPATPSQRTNDASKTLITRKTDWDATPPHRRTSSQSKTMRDSKKRLRELQVEDEFEKLKRDLGM